MVRRAHVLAVGLLSGTGCVFANDNGLAKTPPMGWRSWNLYGANVNQPLIESIMAGMTKKRMVDGQMMSLKDLGYSDVGLDDNWQACNSPKAAKGFHYHDDQGKPLINYDRFPNMTNMTAFAHSLGLTAGWYGNNCICSDHCVNNSDTCDMQIKEDVNALRSFNFDSWKLDGCGGETDLVKFNKYIQETGKPIMVENCHWGSRYPFKPDPTLPPAEGCPWNFYRSSGDVRASYSSILNNLNSVRHLHDGNLSYPGCWAYPDMLQVGCAHGPGGASDPGLSPEETRTHFGAWVIVSSPLTLSHDVNNETITDAIWDVITNREVLAVSQAYMGDSGGVFKTSDTMLTFTDAIHKISDEAPVQSESYQYLAKPIAVGKVAVLMMNSADTTEELTLNFADVPGVTCHTTDAGCKVRDLWAKKDAGTFASQYQVSVKSHDAAFITISA